MNGSMTSLDEYVRGEVEKFRDIYRPVKAGILRRLFVRYLACKKMHPNPDDEFCNPSIGPNYEIVSRYADEIKRTLYKDRHAKLFEEPVMVERISPDGYMLLNGHHRWAAAMRMSVPKIRSKVVDVTQESDIRDMIRNAKHDKRVTLDLDEVVFCTGEGFTMEKALPFPFSLYYKERMRSGIPALFNHLRTKGYDIWVYSEKYHSMEHIRHYFILHRTWVDGIVTGTGRRRGFLEDTRKKLANAITEQYQQTLHIDNNSLLCVDNKTKAYEDYPLTGNPETWSREIIKIVGALDKHEG